MQQKNRTAKPDLSSPFNGYLSYTGEATVAVSNHLPVLHVPGAGNTMQRFLTALSAIIKYYSNSNTQNS